MCVIANVTASRTRAARAPRPITQVGWQMIDIGLLLRARSFRAVKVKYTGKHVTAAGHGVEPRVQRAMRDFFGVVLDWALGV